jgi:Zn-dependent protease
MPSARQGSIHLFRFAGINVYLHWSWFLIAFYEIKGGLGMYSSVTWNIVEYLGLFLIVLLHEFGHSLACRQVGGKADQIVLWPLGGVAFVDPPQRPGATLWSIVAGPLVNVALLPILRGLMVISGATSDAAGSNLSLLSHNLFWIDLVLLVFNILPIYPLDGGQILRSLLWFLLGRARSLLIATILGFIGVAGFIGFALWERSLWYGALAIFMLMNCWSGLQHARALLRMAKLPRRDGFSCPSCKAAPPLGEYWKCGKCGQSFDIFQAGAACPNCATQYSSIRCLDCGEQHSLQQWATSPLVPSHL